MQNSKGRITLVVEPCLQPLLGMVVGPLFSLEAYGVDKMLLLQHPLAQISSHISTKNVVYLLRPEMGWVRVIAHHVSTENANHLVRTGLHIPSKAHRSAIFLSPSLGLFLPIEFLLSFRSFSLMSFAFILFTPVQRKSTTMLTIRRDIILFSSGLNAVSYATAFWKKRLPWVL